MDVAANLRRYLSDVRPTARYASFDYCYNYFQDFYQRDRLEELTAPEKIQESCLQIGFYLASWGMFRGKSFLLQRSVKYFEPLVYALASAPREAWAIDVDTYTDEAIQVLLHCDRLITQAIGQGRSVTSTLTTKIMLGVFGNIPAFDRYFRSGLGIHTLNRKSLRTIARFYHDHQVIIDQHAIYTLDYATPEGDPPRYTHRRYPIAKLIDMIGFVAGGSA